MLNLDLGIHAIGLYLNTCLSLNCIKLSLTKCYYAKDFNKYVRIRLKVCSGQQERRKSQVNVICASFSVLFLILKKLRDRPVIIRSCHLCTQIALTTRSGSIYYNSVIAGIKPEQC